MKRLAVAAMGVAVLGLSACGHSAGANHDAASGRSASHGPGKAIVPVSCAQQYHRWTNGQGKGVMVALDSVKRVATARDTHVLTAALRHARPAVARGTRHPIPACADPRGYWDVLLMHVNAAAASTGSAVGVRAAMHDVPRIMNELTAGVKQTAR